MPRVFFTTTVPCTREILKNGFTDDHYFGELQGVYVGKRPLDINYGFASSVTLCLNVPDEVFNEHEEIDMPEGEPERRTGRALISAADLNQYGPAQIYDHFFAGFSRRELLAAIRRWQSFAGEVVRGTEGEEWKGPAEIKKALESAAATSAHAAEMKAAYDWFDEIGWLTPLRVREKQQA